jgi:Asp-tRNA(Asn)/Glu-tRNA(Gln) amidotransferase A subunit family amidase
MFDQKGKRSTIGVTVRAHDIKAKDCGAVAALRAAGMIPLVRSNATQMAFTF